MFQRKYNLRNSTVNSSTNIIKQKFKLDDFNWYDLYDTYKKNNIIIKDCYSFGLKDIAKQLYKLNIIKDKWIDENIGALDAILVPINGEKNMSRRCY